METLPQTLDVIITLGNDTLIWEPYPESILRAPPKLSEVEIFIIFRYLATLNNIRKWCLRGKRTYSLSLSLLQEISKWPWKEVPE